MTKIKLCGLSLPCDIEAVNELAPEYIGFVFWQKSRRSITPGYAAELKKTLHPDIQAVGVFVDESAERVAELLDSGVIDIAQLHGSEDEDYIKHLRRISGKPVIKAFRVRSADDVSAAEQSSADHILLDSGAGTGAVFDWGILRGIGRPYFLAGGLDPLNVSEAVRMLEPYAVDVSSGVETGGAKDKTKMAAFVAAVRREDSI